MYHSMSDITYVFFLMYHAAGVLLLFYNCKGMHIKSVYPQLVKKHSQFVKQHILSLLKKTKVFKEKLEMDMSHTVRPYLVCVCVWGGDPTQCIIPGLRGFSLF